MISSLEPNETPFPSPVRQAIIQAVTSCGLMVAGPTPMGGSPWYRKVGIYFAIHKLQMKRNYGLTQGGSLDKGRGMPERREHQKRGYRPPGAKTIRISLIMVIVGAILFALVMVFSTYVLSSIFQRELIQISERWIGDVAEILAREIFAELPPAYRNEEFGRSWQEKGWRDGIGGIIGGHVGKLDIIKLKIFNRQGQIIYSTDPEIIGVVDSHNLKLQKALRGEIVSRLEKGQSVWDLVGEKGPRKEMIETYVPMLDLGGKDPFRVVGIFEIYCDVNFLAGALNRARKTFVLFTVGSLLFLFVTFTAVIIRNLERDLVSEKIKAVNEVSVSINHRLNNSLAGILMSLDLLLNHREEYQINDETYLILQKCEKEVRRIQHAISKLSEVTKPVVSMYIGHIKMIDLDKSR